MVLLSNELNQGPTFKHPKGRLAIWLPINNDIQQNSNPFY
jgi:hypothetical protein